MIFTVTKRRCYSALTMGSEPEPDGISINFDPDMTASVTCTPPEENRGVVLLKSTSSFERIFVKCFEHFSEAAFLQDPLRILAYRQACRFIGFSAEDTCELFFFLVRSIHCFQKNPSWNE